MFDDVLTVGLEQDQTLPRGAFPLLRPFAHIMAHAGGAGFHFARSGEAKALFGPAMGLQFGHFLLPLFGIGADGHAIGSVARSGFNSG
jgi:hypothetical protein